VFKALACALIAGAVLAGCSGSNGPAGPAGPAGSQGPPGTPGTPGPVTALDVSTATKITGQITSVSGTSQPTVTFSLVNEVGQPLKGLPATAIRFTAAKLLAGANGGSSQWVSYINRKETASVVAAKPSANQPASWGTTDTRQATAESAATVNSSTCAVTPVGTFVDNGDGTYKYTFSKDLGQMTAQDNPGPGPAIAFDGTLTHRIGFEIRTPSCYTAATLNATNNPVYTYVPATGSTTTLAEQRDIVNTAECSACHDKLAFHGGPRTDVQYCVTCHNPGTTDAQSGNLLDMKVMVHKIHMGENLPTVVAQGTTNAAQGVGYTIWGNSGSFNNFNGIAFPQDLRNCSTCHRESDASTPQASNYYNVVNAEACGTCHDDVNFATGANHSPANLVATDADCLTCHGPTSTIDGGSLRVKVVHTQPLVEASKKFAFQIKSVTLQNTGGSLYPVVTFAVVDPTNSNAAYDLKNPTAANPWIGTDSGGNVCRPGGPARMSIDIGYNTTDYTNFSSGQSFGQPIQLNPLQVNNCGIGSNPAVPAGNIVANADGSYTITSPQALPASGVGTISVSLEGHPAVDVTLANGSPGQDGAAERIAVANVQTFLKVGDATAVQRRAVVNITKCDECHHSLSVHGNNRTDNPQVCVVCHNPSATDGSRRPKSGGILTGVTADGLKEQSIDFKWMIHAIHAGEERAAAGVKTVIYGYGGSVNDFGDLGFPGALNNCEGCHVAGGYYPVDGTKVQGTTYATDPNSTGTSFADQSDDHAASPNAAICGACHVAPVAIAHMKQNGGAPGSLVSGNPADDVLPYFWGKTATGVSIQGTTETCVLCHGQGASADVKVVHGVADFKFN
jgi:OmcA/MtrC family decaheme c-type cytochrome